MEQYFDYDSLPNLVRIFKTGEFHVRSEALAIINVVVNDRELARRLVALGLAQPIVKDLGLDNTRHVEMILSLLKSLSEVSSDQEDILSQSCAVRLAEHL